MASGTYDIITVGGGLGGSSLAKVMAERGARVLVLEYETQFKDRVRGEAMQPWGVPEAQELGIYQLLRDTCGHEVRWWNWYMGSEQVAHRDLLTTTPQRTPELAFSHPAMQEVLLTAAVKAGAEVRRGARVRELQPGALPTVVVEQDGHVEEIRGRLIIGADGRISMVRKWAGFHIQRDPEQQLIAGLLFEGMPLSQDTNYGIINPSISQGVPMFPQGQGRVRAYLVYPKQANSRRLQGKEEVPRFIEESVKAGAAAEWYTDAKAIGPLATFDADDTWVEHPYRAGVALIGDAAASSNPAFGQGMALTLRDVRVLRDQLLNNENWDVAAHTYAEEHARYYGVIHRVNGWIGEIFYGVGPEADARRVRALPLLAQDGTRMPDHLFSGPDLPADETVRRRFFGEE